MATHLFACRHVPAKAWRCYVTTSKQSMGSDTNMEGGFLARRRHLQALEEAANHLQQGKAQLLGAWAGELLAEELRLAQQGAERDHRGVHFRRSAGPHLLQLLYRQITFSP
ncbi:hypothetical protein LNP74_12710 [Klebsiella pneumoniae subsp. pneumoniae]|nr:hypothetical protein [Klebsiella pneumoniae subsp. pneumoniae]